MDQLLNKVIDGWSEDFGGRPEFPNDPFEAIEALKAMKLQFGRAGFGPGPFGPEHPRGPKEDPRKKDPHDQPKDKDWENW